MLSFDLSVEKARLPNQDHWITPDYDGSGDFRVRPNRDNPSNWTTCLGEFDWGIQALEDLKTHLNTAKHKLDRVCKNKKFQVVCEAVRSYDALRTDRGIVVRELGAEVCTNAWLKMYELCSLIDPMLATIENRRSRDFGTLHLAEAPGNFILALNHYLKTSHKVDWHWYANTYKTQASQDGQSYLEDTYGMIDAYPNNWLFGADGDGDITSDANIRSFKHVLGETKIDLVTSDVKYVPAVENYDEEENINGPVQLGALVGSLATLDKGGMVCLKQFTIFEAHSISWLWLMACCFRNLRIVKPETSKAANSEIYVIGLGYKGINEQHLEILYRYMKFVRSICDGKRLPALFKRDDIPEQFIARIVEIETLLTTRQCEAIEQNLNAWEHYKNFTPVQIREANRAEQMQIAREWIDRNKVKPLARGNQLLK